MIDYNKLSPMMKHYFSIKKQYPDCIILYRLGDFYEMFFDDAIKASKILDIALTGRDCGLEERAPMCGVPFHAVDAYIPKLLNAGEKVAICEQLSDPKASKGMVEQGVVRVITPGTITESEMLEDGSNNYLLSVFNSQENFGLSWVDLSTGELKTTKINADDIDSLKELILFINPSEIIGNEKSTNVINNLNITNMNMLPKAQKYYEYSFELENAKKSILQFFNAKSLKALDLEKEDIIISSLGGLIEYLTNTQKIQLKHVKTPDVLREMNKMFLDFNTVRNLELLESFTERTKKGSLLGLLDKTKTSMGARAIKKAILEPFTKASTINNRLDAIEEHINLKDNINLLTNELSKISDIERLCTKIAYNSINPRECRSLLQSLFAIANIKEYMSKYASKSNINIFKKLQPLHSLSNMLNDALIDSPPLLARDGGFIKKGFHPELDKYKSIQKDAKKWLAEYEAKEKYKTGLKTLKIGYNKVFGYYLEVSKSFINQVPSYYDRRQTLSNSERYITAELKEMEENILTAEEKVLEIELEIFDNIKKVLNDNISILQENAKAIAELDVLISLTIVAINNNYSKPIINKKIKHLTIKNGRHPVIEDLNNMLNFVPNDTTLDESCSTIIITGPNMGGKSTIMRQVALIVLLAHIGSYVPAEFVETCIFDRIFTRVGASDNLSFGQSTFMVEMSEVTNIINNATKNSLIILDEIGRGTSTLDGLSIAWAVAEYITTTIKSKTLIATHYHELSELENLIDKVKNYHMLISEEKDGISFLYKIARGSTSKSFGVEVAKMAGLKEEIIDRANIILRAIGKEHSAELVNKITLTPHKKSKANIQMEFFDIPSKYTEVETRLMHTDLNNCTPIQALTILNELKKILTEDEYEN